ncbi:phage-related protein [Mizugakiibacter sediminis]|nr:phage-related protein [Mizugakiibacter sediminis]
MMRDVRELLGKPANKALHFRSMKHEQRVPYVRAIGRTPMRTVSVLINKQRIAEPETFAAEAHRLYRYACRLLLERVSWLCRDSAKLPPERLKTELIFSNRSAMSYEALRGYLARLKAGDCRVDWRFIDSAAVSAINHEKLAGLQIADAVASGLYCAVNLNPYGDAEPRYLEFLSPTFYRYKRQVLGYGLKFWPDDLATQRKTLEHLAAFERHV